MIQTTGTEPMAVSIAEAARRLGISRATAYRLAGDGTMRVVRLRAVRRVPVAEIERLLAATETAGG